MTVVYEVQLTFTKHINVNNYAGRNWKRQWTIVMMSNTRSIKTISAGID